MSTAEQLLARASGMRETLLARGAEADALRRLPDATIDDFIDAQFFSIVAPRAYDGLELDIDVLLEVAKTVGRGCASSAWVLSLLGTHNWMGGLFPEATQRELFADGYLLAPAIIAPMGSIRRQGDDYIVNGRWMFGSGSCHASWVMLSALEMDDDDNITGLRCVAIPIAEVSVEDDWQTAGMRGTGSNSIAVDNVRVPARRTLPLQQMLDGTTEQGLASDNPMYRLPLVPYLSYTAAAPAIGLGLGAIDCFTEYLKQRVMMSGDTAQQKPAAQARLAESVNEVNAAQALVDSGVQRMLATIRSGATIDLEARIRHRGEACYAASLVKRAVDRLAESAGAKAQFESHPLQRYQRDINTLRGHVVFDLDMTMEMYGRSLLGLPNEQPLV